MLTSSVALTARQTNKQLLGKRKRKKKTNRKATVSHLLQHSTTSARCVAGTSASKAAVRARSASQGTATAKEAKVKAKKERKTFEVATMCYLLGELQERTAHKVAKVFLLGGAHGEQQRKTKEEIEAKTLVQLRKKVKRQRTRAWQRTRHC